MGNASTTVLSVSGNSYITGVLSVTGNSIFTTASSTDIVKFSEINSDTGAISFGNENLSTTGTLNVTGLTTLGNASSTVLSVGGNSYLATTTVTGNLVGDVNSGGTYVICASDRKSNQWVCDWTCDGTADDVQIQAAIDACGSTGCTLILTEGTFDIASPMTLANQGVTFKGMGIKATFLNNTQNDDMFQWVNASGTDLGFTTFMHFSADGNSDHSDAGCAFAGGSQTDGSFLDAANEHTSGDMFDVLIEDIFIYDFATHAIQVDNPWGWRMIATTIEFVDGDGVHIDNSVLAPTNSNCMKFIGNKIIANTGSSIYLGADAGACIIANNELSAGKTSSNHGIYFTGAGTKSMVMNNYFATSGCSGATSDPDYIFHDANTASNIIVGNTFSAGGNLVANAITVENNVNVVGNQLGAGYSTGVIRDNAAAGNKAKFSSNGTYLTQRSGNASDLCNAGPTFSPSGGANYMTISHGLSVTPDYCIVSAADTDSREDSPLSAASANFTSTDFRVYITPATCTEGDWYAITWFCGLIDQ